MSLRELDSLSRLALKFRDLEIYSVVFYVGNGAGRHDTGSHQIKNPSGDLTLSWRYKMIRLWKMNAQELVNMGKPASRVRPTHIFLDPKRMPCTRLWEPIK
jgi:hypothetical protein